jgi:Flp pilus assembly protein TadD
MPNEYLFLHSLALAYDQLGRTERTVPLLERVIELEPRYVLAHLNIGTIHMNRGELEKAERELKIAAQLRPDMPDPPFYLGQTYERQGRRDEALRAYRQSLSLDPSSPSTLDAIERLVRSR